LNQDNISDGLSAKHSVQPVAGKALGMTVPVTANLIDSCRRIASVLRWIAGLRSPNR